MLPLGRRGAEQPFLAMWFSPTPLNIRSADAFLPQSLFALEVGVSNEHGRSEQRQGVLNSLRASRHIFARAGEMRAAMRMELGIQLLLDQRVSDRMLGLLSQSAAIAARDAAEYAPPVCR